MYPCVILSRCCWQHTSEIHSKGALITAGLRFPPFTCPAESFSPRQQRLEIQPRRRWPLLPLAAPAAGAVDKRRLSHSWLWPNEVSASDKDAELCNDESDKHPEVGAAGRRRGGRAPAGTLRRLHGDAATRGRKGTERPRREHCAFPSAEPFCSPLTHSSFPGTLHRRLDALSYAVTRLESPYRGVRGCGGTR